VTRRLVAPLLLLAAAALSLAAVFAVHRIEARGGPVGEPSVTTPFISPNGDGVQDTAEIALTTRERERITIDILDRDEHVARRLRDRVRVDGRYRARWDGRDDAGDLVDDGTYVVRIRRDGDGRSYEPVAPIIVDTTKPRGRIDSIGVADGQLRGLALLEPGSTIMVETRGTDPVTRNFTPRDGAVSGLPQGPVPAGTRPVRFVASIDQAQLSSVDLFAADKAGNRTQLHAVLVTSRLEQVRG
jgi:hypothetical protein